MTYPLEDKQVSAFGDAMQDVLVSLPDTERYKKSKQSLLDDLWSDFEYSVIEQMGTVVEGHIRDMAARVVTEILEGREDQMIRYLGSDGYTGRSTERGHPVIHGTLFEQGALALRKKIVDAHADLIKNERILDLEDQVRSLVQQINEKDVALERMREDLRNRSYQSAT